MSTLSASLDTLRADLEVRGGEGVVLAQRIEFDTEKSQIDRLIALLNKVSNTERFYDDVRKYIVKVGASLAKYDRSKGVEPYFALANNGHDRTFVYGLEDSLKAAC